MTSNQTPINDQGVCHGSNGATHRLEQGQALRPKTTLKPKDIWAIRIHLQPRAVRGLRAHDVRGQELGDAAIVRVRTVYTKPDRAAGKGRYIDVWQRRNGRWFCVCTHLTRK